MTKTKLQSGITTTSAERQEAHGTFKSQGHRKLNGLLKLFRGGASASNSAHQAIPTTEMYGKESTTGDHSLIPIKNGIPSLSSGESSTPATTAWSNSCSAPVKLKVRLSLKYLVNRPLQRSKDKYGNGIVTMTIPEGILTETPEGDIQMNLCAVPARGGYGWIIKQPLVPATFKRMSLDARKEIRKVGTIVIGRPIRCEQD